MPSYAFVTESGESIELQMSIAEYDERVEDGEITLDDGRKAKVDWSAFGSISSCPSNYPMESDNMGVNPIQIKDQMAEDARRGVPTSYNPETGAAIYTDKTHRKRHCEAYKHYDRNGGYSDPQRGGRN